MRGNFLCLLGSCLLALSRWRCQNTERMTVIYARVSSTDQKDDLDRQVARLTRFTTERGLSVHRVITEIGSGFFSKRPKLIRLLADPQVRTIVVEHKDRLCALGSSKSRPLLSAEGRRILVADPEEMKDDLVVQDMIDVLTSFCARLYGRRSARNRARKAMEVMQHAD